MPDGQRPFGVSTCLDEFGRPRADNRGKRSAMSLPECPHGNVYVDIRAKELHMICGCRMGPAERLQVQQLYEARWFVSQDPLKSFRPKPPTESTPCSDSTASA